MAKINPYELINQEYTNANGDIYTVKAYIGKDSKLKHLYTIQFNDTKHEQHEERTKVIKGKCRDLMKEKANKSKIKQIKLKERSRLSKKHEADGNINTYWHTVHNQFYIAPYPHEKIGRAHV